MALEDQFQSLTDKLDGLFGSFFSRQQAGQQNLTSRLENAVSQGFGSVQDAVSEIDGGIEPNTRPQAVEEQVESVNRLTSGFENFAEKFQETGESVSGVVDSLASNFEAELSLAGTDAIQQDLNRLEEVFSTLSSSAEVSEDQLQGFASVFEQFGNQVNEVEEQVSAGQISVQDAQQEVQELAGQVQEEFEDITGDRFENFDESIQDLVELSQEFATNVQEAAEVAQDAQGAAFGQDAIQIAGAVSEIGGGSLSFLGTLNDRLSRLTSIVTEEGEEGFGFPPPSELDVTEGYLARIGKEASTFASAISATRVAIAGILAPLAIAADLLEDTFNVARDFRKETGIGAERMRELRNLTADVSTELAGFGLEPAAVGDVALSLVDRFGSIETATAQSGENLETLISQSGRLAGALGVSAERGAEITGTFVELENLIGGSAESGAKLTNQFAEAAEVAPQEAFSQITENAEQLAQFSGNVPDSLARAAVQAQKLGTNLGTVADFQEQSLGDITGQVQKLQEAQMLTGQQFDSTALISASYQGTEETLTEITDQLEGIEFDNLDFFQRQALQEAFPGFSLSELERLSRGREILEETNTTLQRAQAIGEGDLTFAQAVRADDVDEVERLRRQFNQLYFVIAENLFPIVSDLLGALSGLTPLLEAAAPVVRGLSSGLRLLLSPIQLLSGDVKSFKNTLSSVFQPIQDLTTFFKEGSEEAQSFSSVMGALGDAVQMVGVAFGTYFSASYIAGLISSVGGLSGAFATLGSAVTVSLGPISAIAAAIGGLVAIFYNWEEVSGFLKTTLDSFMSTITESESLMKGFRIAASAISPVLSFLGDVVYELGEAFVNLFSLDALFGMFQEGSTAAKILGTALGGLANLMLAPIDVVADAIVYISELVELIYDLGSAVAQGNFGDLGQILIEGLSDIGFSLIDVIFPPGIEDYVAEKMRRLGSIIMEYIPNSPAETGPLSNLDKVNIGGEVAKTIQKEPVEQEMEGVGSTIASYIPGFGGDETQAAGETIEATEVGVQAEGPGVVTVDQNAATEPQQMAAAAQQTTTKMSAQTVTIETDAIQQQTQSEQFTKAQVVQEAGMMQTAENVSNSKVSEQVNLSQNEIIRKTATRVLKTVSDKVVNVSQEDIQQLETFTEPTQRMQLSKVGRPQTEIQKTVQTQVEARPPAETSLVEVQPEISTEVVNRLVRQVNNQPLISETNFQETVQTQRDAGMFAQPQVRQSEVFQKNFFDRVASESVTNNKLETVAADQTVVSEPQKIEILGSPSVQATGKAVEAGEVDVQAEGPRVATVDQNIATGPQQTAAVAQQQAGATQQAAGETREVRLDSETDDVKGVLQDILNTQKQLLSDLRNGNIAVYLDGRKVNQELVRGLGLVE